ncbi:hypothetical protein LINGRAHAP2_LOCUS12163 [Linum grandiflorum]
MQKPAAYRVLVLLLVLIMKTSIKITSVEGGDHQHAKCILPGPTGTYKVVCSRATVGVGHDAPGRLKHLLDYIRSEYLNVFPHASTSCVNPIRNATDPAIAGYGSAYCSKWTISTCGPCLQGAIRVIVDQCDGGAAGAQASSLECCIRYESNPFCTR